MHPRLRALTTSRCLRTVADLQEPVQLGLRHGAKGDHQVEAFATTHALATVDSMQRGRRNADAVAQATA